MVEGDAVVGNVTVDEVVSNGTGWIVIHNNLFGHPGGVIGYTPVESGTNRNVTVTIHTFVATDTSLPSCTTMPGRWCLYTIPDIEQKVEGEIGSCLSTSRQRTPPC